jgi:hypothetical protein
VMQSPPHRAVANSGKLLKAAYLRGAWVSQKIKYEKGKVMSKRIVNLLAAVSILVCFGTVQAGLIVTDTDAAGLVGSLVGSGITVSNITYTGYMQASGLYSGGVSAGITIQNGILLSSGDAHLAVGPNTSDGAGLANGNPGDADLNTLVPGYTTYDAAVLEFDFVSAGGNVFFNYAFGSEEYNEWVGSSYNDVFGFFLDGVNIAKIPGTDTPVAINTVNLLNNSAYYNNNDIASGAPYDIQYDGFTDVFTASALGLVPGLHHIKLGIADSGDSILDSGVFIQAGSFSDIPHPVIPAPGAALLGMIGLGLAGWVKRRLA